MPKPYKTMRVRNHPVFGSTPSIGAHRIVLFDKIGPGPHPCTWCGKELDWTWPTPRQLVVDHLNGDKRDNSSHNLAPSCLGCNAARAAAERWSLSR